MHQDANILIAGASGLVGSAIYRRLQKDGFTNILAPTHAELDLTDPDAVSTWFKQHKPEYVFMAAAKVGGIEMCRAYNRAELIKNITGFSGRLNFDTSKPDGTPQKLLDVSKMTNLGWQARISLEHGIRETYNWYKKDIKAVMDWSRQRTISASHVVQVPAASKMVQYQSGYRT